VELEAGVAPEVVEALERRGGLVMVSETLQIGALQ